MKRVLLPTDFSDNAWNAIRYAMLFLKDEEITFYLLNTFTPTSYHMGYLVENPLPYRIDDISMKNSERDLEIIEHKIKEEFKNLRHRFIKLSAFNTLIGEIIKVVDHYHIDLIIMGTKGATGAKEIFIGTHTMYTIKKVNCPIIAVPSDYRFEEPKDILFPTDYNLSMDNTSLPLVKEICNKHLSRLHILNAYYGVALDSNQQKTKDNLDTYFKDTAHVFHIAEDMDVLEAVENFEKKYKVNLLVMVHNKHSFFENLLFKPVINQIAYHTNIPFLVIPSKERMQ
ncbi:universal stress protein [Aquimarina longa]|uniref:universal stress protein n=1 Tax=Aquimarina longa TaxID=1080221 RepID=UPI0007866CF7|nr:universal stress protein [Aquimarina longa]